MAKRKMTAAEANAKVTLRLRKRAHRELESLLRRAGSMYGVLRSNSMRAPRNLKLNQRARDRIGHMQDFIDESRRFQDAARKAK